MIYASINKEYLQPDEVVYDMKGQSSDINCGFGGK